MYVPPKNDKTIMEAIRLANNGHHYQAASKYQDAGNQVRNPAEKKLLWDAAKRHRRIHESD